MSLPTDFPLVPNLLDNYKGHVAVSSKINYEMFGPFGQRYNIRVSGKGGHGILNYCWRDGGGAPADTTRGEYKISDESVFDSRDAKILELRGLEIFTETNDELVQALFVVMYRYARKTGPFVRPPRYLLCSTTDAGEFNHRVQHSLAL